jgi:Protein of unknown function (DUF2934)
MEKNAHDMIAKVAHDLYEARGGVQGDELQNWLDAERIVLAHHEQVAENGRSKKSPRSATKRGQ